MQRARRAQFCDRRPRDVAIVQHLHVSRVSVICRQFTRARLHVSVTTSVITERPSRIRFISNPLSLSEWTSLSLFQWR